MLSDRLKSLSDIVVEFLLQSTSGFGSRLNDEGREEQRLWRERRLRNLRGLALRARQRWGDKTE